MKTTRLERICAVMLFSILSIGALIFWGYPALVMFDVIKFDPVMSQPPDQVVCVELIEDIEGEHVVAANLTDEALAAFMEDFLSLNFRRYVTHPASAQGERTIKIYYADGGYDLVGDIVDLYDSEGNRIKVRGWYYLYSEEMSYLFDKFTYDTVER